MIAIVRESYTIPPGQNGCPTSDELRRDELRRDDPRDAGTLPETIETAIVAILMCPPGPGETHVAAARNRERALGEVFGHLSAAQNLALARRLDRNRDDDRIAVAFRRFTIERQQRLRAYLADARRR